jgi:hypothetical protein
MNGLKSIGDSAFNSIPILGLNISRHLSLQLFAFRCSWRSRSLLRAEAKSRQHENKNNSQNVSAEKEWSF